MKLPRKLRSAAELVKDAGAAFSKDDAMTQGAALAFYTALSLAPLLLILLWAAGLMGADAQTRLVDELVGLVGAQGGEAIRLIMDSARTSPSLHSLAGIAAFGTLLLSASGVFGQLQHAMNVIWNVEPKPKQGIKGFLRKRLLSLGMILTVGFLLMVSMVASAGLSAAVSLMQVNLPGSALFWRLLDIGLSLLLFSAAFGAIFKVLPDVIIAWRDVVVGAVTTAVLFTAGKILIGLYLGNSSVGSAYGAAGSVIVLLVWVYYSSLLIFFGAELTQVWASRFGKGIRPDSHAKWKQTEVARDPPPLHTRHGGTPSVP